MSAGSGPAGPRPSSACAAIVRASACINACLTSSAHARSRSSSLERLALRSAGAAFPVRSMLCVSSSPRFELGGTPPIGSRPARSTAHAPRGGGGTSLASATSNSLRTRSSGAPIVGATPSAHEAIRSASTACEVSSVKRTRNAASTPTDRRTDEPCESITCEPNCVVACGVACGVACVVACVVALADPAIESPTDVIAQSTPARLAFHVSTCAPTAVRFRASRCLDSRVIAKLRGQPTAPPTAPPTSKAARRIDPWKIHRIAAPRFL